MHLSVYMVVTVLSSYYGKKGQEMKKAWIENNKIRDIAQGNPLELFHSDIAKFYDTDVEDDIVVGAELVDGVWTNPIAPKYVVPEVVEAVEPERVYPKVSPIEFKMLFTSAERIAIKAAKLVEPVLEDAFEILDDPRLNTVDLGLKSNQDLLNSLVVLGLIEPDRVEDILSAKAV